MGITAKKGSFGKRSMGIPVAVSCYLSMLACMITGKLSEFNGIDYHASNYSLFSFFLVLGFFALLPICNKKPVRMAVNLVCALMLLVWVVSVFFIWFDERASDNGRLGLYLQCAIFSYRIISISMSMQLNYYAALNRESDIAPTAFYIGSMTTFLYLLFVLIGGVLASIGLFVATFIALLAMIELEISNSESQRPSFEQTTKKLPIREKPSRKNDSADSGSEDGQPLWMTRSLFFSSRIGWGAMNGTIVGLSTALPFAATTSKPILAVIIFVSLIVFLLAVFINRTDHIPLFLTVLVPGMAYLLILSCFIQQDFLAYGRMLGALTFLPWFIQVYIQLPSYKNLLRMNTARFA